MKYKTIITTFLIILSYIIYAYADTNKILIVTEEYPPFNYIADGEVVGLSTEIIKELMKITGLDYSLKVYPWARALRFA